MKETDNFIFGFPSVPIEDTKTIKNTTNISNIFIDSFNEMVKISMQKGLRQETIDMSIEYAEEIGFINLNALKKHYENN